ncbi:MAG: hypothetical protein HYU37_15155 [Acidobacteria bacterium]|nr:hypothetical protein [Acidobacteriota bacterium]
MRRALLCVSALLLASTAAAQEWDEYKNVNDGFRINFPGQPTITETTWTSEYDYTLPARVYAATRGAERYSVTVVDYAPIEPQALERRKKCPAGAEPCIGSELSGPGYWKHDVRGAIVYATTRFFERNAKVTRYHWSHQDLVEGHQLQLTNADLSRTFAFVGMHEMKLYVVEGTVPAGMPEPGLFQQSMGWVDANGNGIRYQTIYANQFYGLKQMPPPPRAGGGRGRGAGPAPYQP